MIAFQGSSSQLCLATLSALDYTELVLPSSPSISASAFAIKIPWACMVLSSHPFGQAW